MKTLQIFQPGTKVWINTDTPFEVEIEEVKISTTKLMISYHVVWWIITERKDVWVREDEVKIQEQTMIKIGFVKSENTVSR